MITMNNTKTKNLKRNMKNISYTQLLSRTMSLARLSMFTVTALLAMMLTACGSENDDFSVGEDDIVYDGLGTVSRIVTHTKGSGFPIIIMGDGFSENDITNGTYSNALKKTVDALFASEPMASLREYCDVIGVNTVSEQSGITTEKRNTLFGTRLKSTSDVEIYGDSIKIQDYASKVLKSYEMSIRNSQVIVLLNSNQYAGVTLMTEPLTVSDSVPVGFALSYVPISCSYTGGRKMQKDYFEQVLQHEAIGHGIGKLHDEYYSKYDEPEEEYISVFTSCQRNGYYLNIHYDTSTENEFSEKYAVLSQSNKTYNLLLGEHDMEPGSFGYELARSGNYTGEKLRWYQGGALYLTVGEKYTGTEYTGRTYYVIKKNFYRPTWESLMNSVITSTELSFNALSRYAIYARVMKVANGGKSDNLRSASLLEQFMEFDKQKSPSSDDVLAKGSGTEQKHSPIILSDDNPPALPLPKIIK